MSAWKALVPVVAVVGAELAVEEELEEDSPTPSATTAAKWATSPGMHPHCHVSTM